MSRKAWHHTHQSRHARGYDSKWVKTRTIIIARDMGLCQSCKRNGRPTPFAAVDHIKPKAEGGTDDHDNLECVCSACHSEKSLAEALRSQGKTLKPKAQFDNSGRIIW